MTRRQLLGSLPAAAPAAMAMQAAKDEGPVARERRPLRVQPVLVYEL
jgi:hypothetical protein